MSDGYRIRVRLWTSVHGESAFTQVRAVSSGRKGKEEKQSITAVGRVRIRSPPSRSVRKQATVSVQEGGVLENCPSRLPETPRLMARMPREVAYRARTLAPEKTET